MILKGKSHCFGNNINTDYIVASKYKTLLSMEDLATHIMEDVRPGFFNELSPGDFIVATRNFGCGSSRETAPLVIQAAKVSAVIAQSFARIFYRNAINVGLPALQCDTTKIEEGDTLEIDLSKGTLKNLTKGMDIPIKPFPPVMLQLLKDGGLRAHFDKYGGFQLEGVKAQG